jgi:hypothetical protein
MSDGPESEMQLNLPPSLHDVIRLVLARPDLQARLGAEAEAKAFVELLRSIAADHALALDEAALQAVLRPDPLGLGRFAPAPLMVQGWPGPGWLPARSVPGSTATGAPEPAFDWLWFGTGTLTAPFFEDEVRRVSALPLNWLLRTRTTLDGLLAGALKEPGVPLRGLIFHMSRCGSTLLAQMLGAVAGTVVTSEPEPLDAVLRWIAATGPAGDRADAAIQAMVAALGRQRSASAQRYVIKLEVWHTLFMPELRRALPGAGWAYLHRDPVEVLVSLLDQPSIHIVPGALDEARLGLTGYDAGSPVDYAARVLGHCAQAAADHWSAQGGVKIAYPEIRSCGAEAAAAEFGMVPTVADLAAMAQAGLRDAKVPQQVFVADSARKHAAATPEVRAAAERWIAPAYAAITALPTARG